jgi:PAS domain S-box-containing protein
MTRRKRIAEPPPGKMHIFRQRVQLLYQQGAVPAQSNTVLSQALEELAHALEELQAADQALHQQREEWLNQQTALELENQRYKDLFEHAPAGYLVTSIDGAIRQANSAALTMIETPARSIVGRSLAVFVLEGQRRAFRQKIAQVLQATAPQEWVISMCSWEGTPFEARVTASVLRGASGRPLALYWLVCVIDEACAAK